MVYGELQVGRLIPRKENTMKGIIDGLLTFITLVLGLILAFIMAIPMLVLRYGAIAVAIYIVYRPATWCWSSIPTGSSASRMEAIRFALTFGRRASLCPAMVANSSLAVSHHWESLS